MRPEEWSRVKELFGAALPLAADARQSHLDNACGGDEALRDQVRQLLACHEHAHSFLETPPRLPADDTLTTFWKAAASVRTSSRRRIGAGGMGKVYRARDTRLDRTVAIKAIPTHFAADADPVARDRFEREARAVAALNAPTTYEE